MFFQQSFISLFILGCLTATTEIPEWGIKTGKQGPNDNLYNLRRDKSEL